MRGRGDVYGDLSSCRFGVKGLDGLALDAARAGGRELGGVTSCADELNRAVDALDEEGPCCLLSFR